MKGIDEVRGWDLDFSHTAMPISIVQNELQRCPPQDLMNMLSVFASITAIAT